MTAELKYSTIGVKGGDGAHVKKIGLMNVSLGTYLNNQNIIFDAFEGSGKGYKRRDKVLIQVTNPIFTWSGTFEQLIEQLQK